MKWINSFRPHLGTTIPAGGARPTCLSLTVWQPTTLGICGPVRMGSDRSRKHSSRGRERVPPYRFVASFRSRRHRASGITLTEPCPCNMNRCLSSCRAWISLLALAVAFSAGAEEAASETEVVLTLDSFDDVIAKHPFVLFGCLLMRSRSRRSSWASSCSARSVSSRHSSPSSKQLGELLQRALGELQAQQAIVCMSSKQRNPSPSIPARL
jgi:hypothetical protein